jgi:DNA invertase Pin-like site-specific DNA recombinase
MPALRASIYARVSSRAQSDRHTIDSQLPVLRAFVSARGWTTADEYVDDGRTARAGHLDARAGFTRLVRDAAAGRFNVVVVFDLDRLTRSEDLTERGAILGAFQRAGVKIAIATSGQILDLTSSMGDLFSGLQAFFAAEENRKRSERTIAGKARAVAENRPPGTPPPYGLTYSRGAGWGIDPDEAAIVREVFARVARGEACQALDRDLHDRGVRSARGGEWAVSGAYKIITSSAYRGAWVVSKARGWQLDVPRIVDDETWYAAQDKLRHVGKLHLRRTRTVYLLEGLGLCDLCRAQVSVCSHGFTRAGVPLRPPTYVCRHRARPVDGVKCPAPHWRTDDVDDATWSAIIATIARRDLVEELLARRSARARGDGADWQAEIAAAQKRLGRLARAEGVILDRFRRGMVSDAAMDAELTATARERAQLERRVADARRSGASATRAQESAQALAGALATIRRRARSASAGERQTLVRALLGSAPVVVGKEQIRMWLDVSTAAAGVGQVFSACWTTTQVNTLRGVEQLWPLTLRRAA